MQDVDDLSECRMLCRATTKCEYLNYFHATKECAAFTICKVVRPGRNESTIEWINGALVPDDVGGRTGKLQ